MEETVLYPSPNWFLPSVLRVSQDGWLVYGGPGKSLVVLEPLPPDFDGVIDSTHRHRAHVVQRGHKERIVSVDISPEWPDKRHFASGSADGVVTEWTITQVENKWSIKSIYSHEGHAKEREEVIGVGYSMATHIISVGSFSNVIAWELNTNTTKVYSSFMRHFKATCMSCSPHSPLVVAVGTKQGVVFVLDLNGKGNVVYKVRGQDDEIAQVTWCPQYEVVLKRSLQEKKSLATQRLEQIRNEPEPSDPDASGADKTLPEDSFDNSVVVPEDDTFDIYKDHEANEFGHKKYQPEDIVVKKKVEPEKDDFLAECERLKAHILKNKQEEEEEETIETLVEAMDKAHVGEPTESKSMEAKTITGVASLAASGSRLLQAEGTDHVHKHLLASISKNGFSVRIWSKTGKIVASCAVMINSKNTSKAYPNKSPHSGSLHWYEPESLLITDGKTHLLECNPLNVDCKNKLHWSVLHSSHRRGLYYVTSNAPRVQTTGAGAELAAASVWTVGQDRYLIKYDMNTRAVLAKFGTCGGYLYDVRSCPYDAGKVSIGVGDGALRLWENQSTGEEDCKLTFGEVTCYWQNVQGKILQCAWHPTRENLLAFSTAEARVGLIDISQKGERAAKVLQSALTNGVYSIAWGDGMALFAVGGRELVMYQANKPDQAPIPIQIEIEGQKWEPTVVNHSARGLAVASTTGGVAVFSGPGGHALAAKFVFTGSIQAMEWHPQQTSSSDEESKYKDLLAITAVDKTFTIVIVQYEDKEGGGKQFSDFTKLTGHTNKVFQAYWSPHREGQLLSSSQDFTIRVWDAIGGMCLSIFDGHSASTMGAVWCAPPQLADKVLSGGSDFCLRLWDINDYPAENYKEKKEVKPRKKKNKAPLEHVPVHHDKESDEDKEKDIDNKETDVDKEVDKEDDGDQSDEEEVAVALKRRVGKRFILPIMARQLTRVNAQALRVMLQKSLQKDVELKTLMDAAKENNPNLFNIDFLKLFGNTNEVNEVLDMECENHLALKAYNKYVMLMIFRGRIDSVIQFANENDLLDTFLLSVAPCVSFKYWKDVTQLYVAQIARLAVKKYEDLPTPLGSRDYMSEYSKTAALLSIHDIKGAVEVLETAKLYKEAYILCRCRHMDSIAAETLSRWAWDAGYSGNLMLGSFLYIASGDITKAATLLRRSNNQDYLNLAAELAKSAGHNMFADYLETKMKSVEKEPTAEEQTEELLEALPTKMELLMKENKAQNGESKIEDIVKNGNQSSFNEETVEN